jgi:hypothetical protein
MFWKYYNEKYFLALQAQDLERLATPFGAATYLRWTGLAAKIAEISADQPVIFSRTIRQRLGDRTVRLLVNPFLAVPVGAVVNPRGGLASSWSHFVVAQRPAQIAESTPQFAGLAGVLPKLAKRLGAPPPSDEAIAYWDWLWSGYEGARNVSTGLWFSPNYSTVSAWRPISDYIEHEYDGLFGFSRPLDMSGFTEPAMRLFRSLATGQRERYAMKLLEAI